MDLAIIITTHNRNDLRLSNCLRTLLSQNTTYDYGIYIADIGSTDNLPDLLGTLNSDKLNYMYIDAEPNKALANNIALKAIDADIIVATDGYCLFQNTLVEAFCTKITNDNLLVRARRPSYAPEYLWKDTSLTPEDFETFRLQGTEWLEEELQVGLGSKRKRLFAAKREAFLNISGYDERLVNDEDIDIVRRLLQSGLVLEDITDDIAMVYQPSLEDVPLKATIGQLKKEDLEYHESYARYRKGPDRNINRDWGQI